jgi:predicted DCC family thiol-disulfide oxidoreductase YuxK
VAWTVIYDETCGFCRWCVGVLLGWDRDGRLRPVPAGSAHADELLTGMPAETRFGSWHLVAPDGEVHSGGLAAAPLLRLLPGGRLPAALVARVPRLADRAYRFVARNRRGFGRLVGTRARARADARLAGRL